MIPHFVGLSMSMEKGLLLVWSGYEVTTMENLRIAWGLSFRCCEPLQEAGLCRAMAQ